MTMQAILQAAEQQSGGTSALGPLLPEVYDLVWSAVVFVIILFVLIRYGLPRINKVLDQRSAAIEGNIEKAEAREREAEEVLERYNQQLAESRAEASRIREQAREEGRRIIADMREQAQAEADRITTQAHAQIEAERTSAAQSLRQDVGSLALQLASNIVGEHLNDDANATRLVDRFLTDLDVERAGDSRA
jgi:F-type H+-transporting ATPase subunit b